jgi:hypothetical protein
LSERTWSEHATESLAFLAVVFNNDNDDDNGEAREWLVDGTS